MWSWSSGAASSPARPDPAAPRPARYPAASACSKSAHRSSGCSSPTDTRTVPSPTRAAWPRPSDGVTWKPGGAPGFPRRPARAPVLPAAARHERQTRLAPAGQVEGDHAAEAGQETPRGVVVGVVRQAGPVHPGHGRVRGELAGQVRGVRAVPFSSAAGAWIAGVSRCIVMTETLPASRRTGKRRVYLLSHESRPSPWYVCWSGVTARREEFMRTGLSGSVSSPGAPGASDGAPAGKESWRRPTPFSRPQWYPVAGAAVVAVLLAGVAMTLLTLSRGSPARPLARDCGLVTCAASLPPAALGRAVPSTAARSTAPVRRHERPARAPALEPAVHQQVPPAAPRTIPSVAPRAAPSPSSGSWTRHHHHHHHHHQDQDGG
jgi:hypothetical protein